MHRTSQWCAKAAVLSAVLAVACTPRTTVNDSPQPGVAVEVSITPRSATLAPNAVLAFQADVSGASDSAVAWSASCGSITAAGLYRAPAAAATCTVSVTSHADPTRTATATVDVVATVAPWRPFSAGSPWNTPLPTDPVLAPDSAALVADFMNSSPYGVHLDVNISGYSIPLYWADGATPTHTVIASLGGEGWTSIDGTQATATMPIPVGAVPDPLGDHHLLVVDRQRNLEWGCWNMTESAGKWSAGVCAIADLNGTGVRTPVTQARPWYLAVGARACGFPLVAGLIRTEEIAAGRIDHALVVAYPHVRAGVFTSPASTAQARVGDDAISTRGIPCGGRLQFDPSVNLDALDLSRSGRIIMRALQEYGAYVGDYSGALTLYAENSAAAQAFWSTGVLQMYELLGRIDMARCRVIEIGTLHDNGNGN